MPAPSPGTGRWPVAPDESPRSSHFLHLLGSSVRSGIGKVLERRSTRSKFIHPHHKADRPMRSSPLRSTGENLEEGALSSEEAARRFPRRPWLRQTALILPAAVPFRRISLSPCELEHRAK